MRFLEDIAIWTQLRPRVLHSLPGRLRLRIGLLQRLPDDWLNVVEILETVIAAPNGIESASSDRRTGSLLVRYDADRLEEADVLGYVDSLLDLLRRNSDRLKGMSNRQAVRAAGRLEAWVRQHARQRPLIDPKAEIPDEVWS